jgi:hypothetical protein
MRRCAGWIPRAPGWRRRRRLALVLAHDGAAIDRSARRTLGLAVALLLLTVGVGPMLASCSRAPDDDTRREPSTSDADDDSDDENNDDEVVFGDGALGDVCSFNADCGASLRCACDGDCSCQPGVRGTGRLGDPCEGGDDCASSVCVEGPDTGTSFLCSDACDDDDDCAGELPVCADVALVGRLCIRQAPTERGP